MSTSPPTTTFPATTSIFVLADVLRYHILLQFLSWSDLRVFLPLPTSSSPYSLLLQFTGHATDNFDSVNFT
ncbi:hypothetical protein GYH30_024472 [Glycine max]|nr:hypothetical protein GYH30_024472 [Glycine max]